MIKFYNIMRKSFLLLISVIFISYSFAQNASEYNVSLDDAKHIAENFIKHQSAKINPIKYKGVKYSIKNTNTITNEGSDYFHVVNYNNGGFVLVSADKRAVPVLAYSFEDEFDYNNMAPGTKEWIKYQYILPINTIRTQNLEPKASVIAQWENMLRNDFSNEKSVRGIEPLVETKWNQDSPYNMYCPEHPEGPGGRTYAGCVATTMSQIMKFWDYPEVGRGEYEFFWGDYQTVNFGETHYRWDEMTVTANSQSKDAIAELMFHCGVSVNMDWGYDGSGTQTEYAVNALKQYFRYRTGIYYVNKSDLFDDVWKLTIKEELDKGHPIIYSGNPQDGGTGHAFVCDAYQDTSYFHFNWGWGGYNDGFFYLDDMTPGDLDFSYYNTMVLNIAPPNADFCAESTIYTQPEWTFEDGSGSNYYYNNTNCSWLIAPEVEDIELLRLTFTKFNLAPNDVLRIYKGRNGNASLDLVGEFTSNNRPNVIDNTDGDRFYLVFETDGEGQAEGWEASYTTFATGIDKNELNGISLYPNPANETINITGIYNSNVKIYDIYGKMIKDYTNIDNTSIDISDLAKGVYFVKIDNKAGSKTLKFVRN